MPNKGLLLVTMEPPATFEEEFNDWYDTEHFPQRRGLPGFESASRWVCLSGWPRWLAVYDLVSVEAVDTEEYAAVSGPNSTPWSRRLLPRTVGRRRVVAQQVVPGAALSMEPQRVSRLLLVRFAALSSHEEEAVTTTLGAFQRPDGLMQLRIFRSSESGGVDIWVIAEFDRIVSTALVEGNFSVVAGIGARMLNLYSPYERNI